ncbi:MAG: guanylate kinase [Actinomycetota bacterium]|jgi:guanylate kinase|nr:guanylate kinase [Actinomycetota bacterium]
MRKSTGRGRIFVISGPSGAGKGTVVAGLMKRKPELILSVSATTRPARPGERHGIDYEFISKPEFLARRYRGGFLEWAEVFDNLYGTPRASVDQAVAQGKDVILELDIQGALAVKRIRPEAVLVFIEPPSLEDLLLRLRGRGTEDPETISKRVKAAYEEVKNKGLYDYIVVNANVQEAEDELVRILDERENERTEP